MLSIKFGYGRPAFAARAFAALFADDDSGVDFFFGFLVFQTSLAITSFPYFFWR